MYRGTTPTFTFTLPIELQLRGDTELQIQLRVGVGSARMASQVFRVPVSQILKDGVLT